MILGLLDVEDLLKLFDDKTYRPRVLDEFTRRLTTALALFVPDPDAFRGMMREVGGLVGGSVALWFTTSLPRSWRPQHLDLLVPPGCAHTVRKCLLAVRGAEVVSGKDLRWELSDNWYLKKEVYCVWTTRGVVRVIHGIYQNWDALSLVPRYWGTHLMNVLSADALVVPYMRLTLLGRAIGKDVREAIGDDETAEGYDFDKTPEDPRGFTLHESGAEFANLRKGCYNFVGCRQRERWFTDKETLLIQIGRGGGEDPFQSFRRSCWGWKLDVDPCANRSCFFTREFTIIPHGVYAMDVMPAHDM